MQRAASECSVKLREGLQRSLRNGQFDHSNQCTHFDVVHCSNDAANAACSACIVHAYMHRTA
jgi:hypothetical protein